MSLDNDTARLAVSADAATHCDRDGHSVLAFIASVFNRPYTHHSVEARLPRDTDLKTAQGLALGFSALGLRSRLLLQDILTIDKVALPFVIMRVNEPPLVVTDFSEDGRKATVVDPCAGGLQTDMKMGDLHRLAAHGIMLVTPDEEAATKRFTAATSSLETSQGHWFWAPVRSNWRGWAQVGLAALLLNILMLALPLFVMNVYDKVIPNQAFVTLWTLSVGVAIALALDLVLRTMRGSIIENISRRVDIKVASALFRQAMQVRLLDRPGGAAGIASTIRDFEVVREFFASATFVAVIDLLFIGVFVAALFYVVGPIALVPLFAVPLVLALSFAAQLPLGRAAGKAQQMGTKKHTVLIEALSGIETVKSLNAEPLMQKEWENAVAASSQVNSRTKFWSGLASNGAMLVQQAVSVLMIVWGVFLVSEGSITIGGLIAANILAGRVLAPLGTIAQTIFRAQYARKSLSALNSFMALPVEPGAAIASEATVTTGAVEVRNVSFTYPKSQVPALRDFSLRVEPGECVALLGRVGSGKTTLGKVLSGLVPVDSGMVLVDGVALAQYDPSELRRGIGYLPQTPDLFTGSLRENLTIGAPNVTDDDIHRSLYFAGMDEFLAQVPEGFDLFLGEKGARLSGGQRQGVALARLLLRRPKTVFLDEPTNAMDQSMQEQVISRLAELNREGVGLIISTHRQSLAAMADRLIVMEQGRSVLDGARDDILTKLRRLTANKVP